MIGRGEMASAERSFEAAARAHGAGFDRAFRRVTALDRDDPMARKVVSEMVRAANPGEFLMRVFGDAAASSSALDAITRENM